MSKGRRGKIYTFQELFEKVKGLLPADGKWHHVSAYYKKTDDMLRLDAMMITDIVPFHTIGFGRPCNHHPEVINWNGFNKVVQCYICGSIYWQPLTYYMNINETDRLVNEICKEIDAEDPPDIDWATLDEVEREVDEAKEKKPRVPLNEDGMRVDYEQLRDSGFDVDDK